MLYNIQSKGVWDIARLEQIFTDSGMRLVTCLIHLDVQLSIPVS